MSYLTIDVDCPSCAERHCVAIDFRYANINAAFKFTCPVKNEPIGVILGQIAKRLESRIPEGCIVADKFDQPA
jgi:hypothetical protein